MILVYAVVAGIITIFTLTSIAIFVSEAIERKDKQKQILVLLELRKQEAYIKSQHPNKPLHETNAIALQILINQINGYSERDQEMDYEKYYR